MALVSKIQSPEKLVCEEKHVSTSNQEHLETVATRDQNFVYDDSEHEPELHIRTYIAIASMFIFNLVCSVAVLSPPAVVSITLTAAKNYLILTWDFLAFIYWS
jgi:hypothetical protein